MRGTPEFANNNNIIFKDGRYKISPDANITDKERKRLEKQILSERKAYLNHLNRSLYRGYLKMDKEGNYYMSEKAPLPLKKDWEFGLDTDKK